MLAPGTLIHFGDHSCDPNVWHVGPYVIATRRAAGVGDELTIDHGTQSGAAGFAIACSSDSPICRRVVSSDDWRLPERQARYRHHWVRPWRLGSQQDETAPIRIGVTLANL